MRAEARLDAAARVLRRGLEAVVIALIVSLAVVVVAGVAFRKAGAALVWYDEVASILLAWLTYYGAAYAAMHRAHIGFPKLVQGAPPRVRRGLFVAREAVVIGFFTAAAWAGWQVIRVLEGTTLVSIPWIPASVSQSVIPIGAVLFILAEITSMPRAWRDGAADAVAEEEP